MATKNSSTTATHAEMANFIWNICNLLRGPYKRNEHRKVILPLTVLRRFDCLLVPTKEEVLAEYARVKDRPESVIRSKLQKITGLPFYNLSRFTFHTLLDDPENLAPNLNGYINGFSPNVRKIMERFAFSQQIAKMDEKNLLYEVIKAFDKVNLSPDHVDNIQMGYIFEELIRIGSEQSNEEAGEHFTPREVIKLIVNLLLSPEKDLARSHVVKTIFDPACGTGGMLSVAEQYIHELNAEAKPLLYGQDLNDEAWAVCKSDMLIKGEEADNIRLGDSFAKDSFSYNDSGEKITFDYMLANPPFGVEWKTQQAFITKEYKTLGYNGRFGAGLPRINDGSLLFLQHMISKMCPPEKGGSRIGIVFNGSPLFTGDAGSGESEIRRWIIENDWLEAIIALPLNIFYNTGIATYIWVLTNRKPVHRQGKVQLIDATEWYKPLRKNLGKKNCELSDDDLKRICDLFLGFKETEQSKIFPNAAFGYWKVTVERPLRLKVNLDADTLTRFRKTCTAGDDSALADFIETLGTSLGSGSHPDFNRFISTVVDESRKKEFKITAKRQKMIQTELTVKDEQAQPVIKKKYKAGAVKPDPIHGRCTADIDGKAAVVEYEPDTDLRDSEQIPLLEVGGISEFFSREVLPHMPDAWIDEAATKTGYEISFTRYFYKPKPMRALEDIRADIVKLENETEGLLQKILDTSTEG